MNNKIAIITSENDLKDYCETRNMAQYVFDGTECGCVYYATEEYVSISGYVEGSDIECPEHKLFFPFSSEDWWNVWEDADKEGCDLWKEYHKEEV